MNYALHIADSVHDYRCLPATCRALGPSQNGEPVGMGSPVGLGKRLTQSTRPAGASQPSPACGLGLGQQHKNNTLPKQPGHSASPPLPSLPPGSCRSAAPVPWSTSLSTHTPLRWPPGGSKTHSTLCLGGQHGAPKVKQRHAHCSRSDAFPSA